jgi:hypothetical protein
VRSGGRCSSIRTSPLRIVDSPWHFYGAIALCSGRWRNGGVAECRLCAIRSRCS